MSKRKRTFLDAKDIRVGECITVAGTVLVVAEHEVTEHGVNISCMPTSPHGWSLHVMSLHPHFQLKVPRHHQPMFPNSRAEILARDLWEDHDE